MGAQHAMAWVEIIDQKITGPYYLPDGRVNGESYLQMLREYVIPELEHRGIDPNEVIYMHDGAPPHISIQVREFLNQNFQGFIGRGQGSMHAWPPRSPDLNPLDFFCGHSSKH